MALNTYLFTGCTTPNLGDLAIKIEDTNFSVGNTVVYSGYCYEYTGTLTGATAVGTYYFPAYTNCTNCLQGQGLLDDCYSATTQNGAWSFTDCCGVERTGVGSGQTYCVDTSQPYFGVTISASNCVPDCYEGPLAYSFSVTGVCENPSGGTISISPSGGTKPYTIENDIPATLSAQTGNGPFIFTGLTGGTYVFRLNDSTGNINADIFINVNVTGCICASINNVSGTTCGDPTTGELTVNVSSGSSPYNFTLYKNNVAASFVTSNNSSYTFSNLDYGIYHVLAQDFGGATAFTESVVVNESDPLDFGFAITGDSECVQGLGIVKVTGQTGSAPYTYLWSDGQTTETATGLTSGNISVTVTDNNECSTLKTATIPFVNALGLMNFNTTQSSCFNCDGSFTMNISGGTPPYYYSVSNGYSVTTNSTSLTLTGLCPNVYSVQVSDNGYCQIVESVSVPSDGAFTIDSVNITNSVCGNNGSIEVNVSAQSGEIITYTLTGATSGAITTVTTQSTSHTFNNLSGDTYYLDVTTSRGCSYQQSIVINNLDPFNVSFSTTGATCGDSNGVVDVTVTSGTTTVQYPLIYILTDSTTGGVVEQSLNNFSSAFTYNSLAIGSYGLSVEDNNGCTSNYTFTITGTPQIDFILTGNDCVLGDDGSASVSIYEGEPPFTYLWNNGQTGSTITGLSGGTYTVTVTDADGCNRSKAVNIICKPNNVACYEIFEICESGFITTSKQKRGLSEMLNESYIDLISGSTGCTLNTAEFSVNVILTGSGINYNITESFYTGTTLNDVPTDSLYRNTIRDILNSISEIGSYNLNLNTNTIRLFSDCDGDEDPLRDAYFKLTLSIDYDIDCLV